MIMKDRYADRIVQDPAILVGKPVIRGTRLSVELVLGQLAANPDLDELFAMYPRLTRADVQAVLAYAQATVERGNENAKRIKRTLVASGSE